MAVHSIVELRIKFMPPAGEIKVQPNRLALLIKHGDWAIITHPAVVIRDHQQMGVVHLYLMLRQ